MSIKIIFTALFIAIGICSFGQDLSGLSLPDIQEKGVSKLKIYKEEVSEKGITRVKKFNNEGSMVTEILYTNSKRIPSTKTTFTYNTDKRFILSSVTTRLDDDALLYNTQYTYTDTLLVAKKSYRGQSKTAFKQVKISYDSLGKKTMELYMEEGYSYSKKYHYEGEKLVKMIFLKRQLEVEFTYTYVEEKLESVTAKTKKKRGVKTMLITYFYKDNLLEHIEVDDLSYFYIYEMRE